MKRLLLMALGAAFAVGCGPKIASDADAKRLQESFSQASYEEGMRKAGKTAELEAEKKRNEEYLRRGGGG